MGNVNSPNKLSTDIYIYIYMFIYILYLCKAGRPVDTREIEKHRSEIKNSSS